MTFNSSSSFWWSEYPNRERIVSSGALGLPPNWGFQRSSPHFVLDSYGCGKTRTCSLSVEPDYVNETNVNVCQYLHNGLMHNSNHMNTHHTSTPKFEDMEHMSEMFRNGNNGSMLFCHSMPQVMHLIRRLPYIRPVLSTVVNPLGHTQADWCWWAVLQTRG